MKKLRLFKITIFSLILAFLVFAKGSMTVEAEEYDDIQAFPESYREALISLKEQHPQWVFVPINVNTDWDNVIKGEMSGARSLVHSSKSEAWRTDLHSPGWYYATKEAVEYCMDPRNYLLEDSIFMFEQLTFSPQFHNAEGVQKILQSSFMSGEVPGENVTYAELFFNVGRELGVSPYHLASRVMQEQGRGTSPLISGNYPGYEGLYNYFNVSASGNTNEQIIVSGLTYARSNGWVTRVEAIKGGASLISASYILKGQDSLYLQKFNVCSSFYKMFTHQYMQNITAPTTEGASIYKAYQRAGALENGFVFKIPVYKNMPEEAAPVPKKIENPIGPVEPTQPVTPIIIDENVLNFVSRMYTVALNRDAELAGLNDWCSQLMQGKNDGAGLAVGFINSQEFKNRGLSDSDYLDVLYRTFFDREPDEGGKNDWLQALDSGRSREYILSGFVNSQEFQNLADSFGIKRGELYTNGVPKHEGVRGYVERIYIFALDRVGEEEGIQNWVNAINNKEVAPMDAVKHFLNSEEFINRGLDSAAYVETMYWTYMGREPDKDGKVYWLNLLLAGERTRDEVADGFALSNEFMHIVESFDLLERTVLVGESTKE